MARSGTREGRVEESESESRGGAYGAVDRVVGSESVDRGQGIAVVRSEDTWEFQARKTKALNIPYAGLRTCDRG